MHKVLLTVALMAVSYVSNAAECEKDLTVPSESSIQFIQTDHPQLGRADATIVARYLEDAVAISQRSQIEEISGIEREFDSKSVDLILEFAGFHLTYAGLLPDWVDTLNAMEAEEISGLKKVSPELEPQVRMTAATMMGIAQIAMELNLKAVTLSAERFVETVEVDKIADAAKKADSALCVLEAAAGSAIEIAKAFPKVLTVVSVKNLYY